MPLTDIPFEISSTDVVETENPHSIVLGPVYDNFTQDAKIVGTVAAVIDWSSFFSSFLAVEDHPVLVVMHGSCGDDMSFEVVVAVVFTAFWLLLLNKGEKAALGLTRVATVRKMVVVLARVMVLGRLIRLCSFSTMCVFDAWMLLC